MNIIKIKNNFEEFVGEEESKNVKEILIGEENGEESGICGVIYKNGKMEIIGLRMDREVKDLEEMENYIKKGF